MKKLAQANEEKLFVKKETVEGTLVYPTTTDAILAVGAAASNQDDEFLEDGQIRGRRSRLSPIKGRTMPGAWSFTTYIKPSGSLGVAPEADVLFNCALGKKTVNSGVSVVYSLDSSVNLPSFSMLRKVGHTVFFMAGCTVNVAEWRVSGAEIAQAAWNGEFMKWWYAGETTLQAEATMGGSSITVVDAERFTGANKIRITIGSANNGGVGYLVTSIDYATKALGISPTLESTQPIASVVSGWYPSTSTEVGVPVHGKLGIVTIDTKSAVILEATITLTNNIRYYSDTKNGQWYPTVYGAPGFRDVNGVMRLYFYKNIPNYFYRSQEQVQNHLIVPAGSLSGKIMEIDLPRIEYKTPAISGDEDVMTDINFSALSSTAGDDEISVTFK